MDLIWIIVQFCWVLHILLVSLCTSFHCFDLFIFALSSLLGFCRCWYSPHILELFLDFFMSIFRNDYEMLLALDTDNDRHRGASWESISQLPVTTLAVSFDFLWTVSFMSYCIVVDEFRKTLAVILDSLPLILLFGFVMFDWCSQLMLPTKIVQYVWIRPSQGMLFDDFHACMCFISRYVIPCIAWHVVSVGYADVRFTNNSDASTGHVCLLLLLFLSLTVFFPILF